MADQRIKYGLSLGPYGNFQARTDGLITAGDTTPDVSLSTLLYTANTSATSIVDFEGILQGGIAGVEEGKEITIVFLDSATTIANAGRLYLSSTANTFPTNSTLRLIHHNSAWYELSRSKNQTTEITTPAVTAVAGSFGVSVTNVRQLIINNSGAADVLVSFSGGDVGQSVYVVPNTTNTLFLHVRGALGNISAPGTGSFLLSASGVYEFQKIPDLTWRLVKGGASV